MTEIKECSLNSLKVIDSLVKFYENLRNKYYVEINHFDTFFANFEDSIVLIGPEEATFQDLAPTPMDKEPVPKVSVHGNVIKTLSSEIFIKRMFDSKGSHFYYYFLTLFDLLRD